jgi:hypothetical protein
VRLQPRVIEYGPTRVSISGIRATSVQARLRGADDPAGVAYRWTPYRWRPLRLVQRTWRGVLPAPPLRGIYQLQLRVQHSTRLLQSPHWLLRSLPPGRLNRSAFRTPLAVIRDYLNDLPDNPVLVAIRTYSQAAYDHRNPRLHRIFVVAVAPRGDNRPSSQLGAFITTFRNGYHGRWRLRQVTTEPPS